MIRLALAAALIATPALASAQATQGQTPQRIREVTLTGDQACPPSTADEVVVCRKLENPYRIPEGLRDSGPIAAQNRAWATREQELAEIGRRAGGVPNSCSPIGTAGQTGCAQKALNAWYAEKRAQAGADPAN